MLEHLPTDRLHGKVAATVVVTLDHDKLRNQAAAAGLDTGDRISAAETRRLACGAGILPAILSGASQVLDLGRTQRFFTEAQRTALATRHTTCAADGCDRPFAWCELHHAPALVPRRTRPTSRTPSPSADTTTARSTHRPGRHAVRTGV